MSYEELQRLNSKFMLSVKEAAALFGIGEKKIRKMIVQYDHHGLFVRNGSKWLVIRERFANFLGGVSSI